MTRPLSDTVPALCDHTSVGVLISSAAGLLVFERATPPVGIAPVAGHIDAHGGSEQAAMNEVAEEVGLTVTRLHLLHQGWRTNQCRRPTGGPVGHQWTIFAAQTSGQLHLSAREVRAPRWLHPDELQQCAQRTAAFAAKQITAAEFALQPGLQPVWVRFLHELQVITMTGEALDRIDEVI